MTNNHVLAHMSSPPLSTMAEETDAMARKATASYRLNTLGALALPLTLNRGGV